MIFCNGEIVKLKGKDVDDLGERINKEIKDIKKWIKENGDIQIRYPDNILKQNSNGLIEYPTGERLKFLSTVTTDEGTMEIRYCETYRDDPKKGAIYSPRGKKFGTGIVLTARDAELAWYLLYIYKGVRWDKSEWKPKGSGHYVVLDPKGSAKSNLAIRRLRLAVESKIISPHVHGGLTNSKVETLAMAYGISIQGLTNDQIRNTLMDHIDALQSVNSNSYEKFINDSDLNSEVKMRAQVMEYIDIGLVIYKEGKWVVAGGSEGKTIRTLFPVQDMNEAFNELVYFIKTKEKEAADLESAYEIRKGMEKEINLPK